LDDVLPTVAVADKRLRAEHLTAARWDIAIGALLTQFIMAAVLRRDDWPGPPRRIAGNDRRHGTGADTIPRHGNGQRNLRVGLGAGMVATIIVSLAFAWGLGEVTGYRCSLEMHPFEAHWFYAVCAMCVVFGALVVAVWPDLVSLNVAVQVINAFMLPLVFGFLIALAVKALPRAHRLRGFYLSIVVVVAAVTCTLGVFGGLSGVGLM
jgi:energy-converting hydrogenase Eha subunit E